MSTEQVAQVWMLTDSVDPGTVNTLVIVYAPDLSEAAKMASNVYPDFTPKWASLMAPTDRFGVMFSIGASEWMSVAGPALPETL